MVMGGGRDGVGEGDKVGEGELEGVLEGMAGKEDVGEGVLVTDDVPLGVRERLEPKEGVGVGVRDGRAVPLNTTGSKAVECAVVPPYTFMRTQNPGALSPAPPGITNVDVFVHVVDVTHSCTFPSCTNAPSGPLTP